MKHEYFYLLVFWMSIIVTAVVVAMILRPIIKYFENFLIDYRAAQILLRQRKDGVQGSDVTRFRQTDNMSKLRREDRAVYKRGEELLQQGQLIPAANIFESIGFSRKAIDILEGAGLIDDACAVLIRMNSIGRAGVIYERNKMFEKAARCYTDAQQHEQAGKAFMKLTKKDFRYFNSAAESFAKANNWHAHIQAVGEVLDTPRILDAAFNHGQLETLANYLSHPDIARNSLENLGTDSMNQMLSAVALSPKMVIYTRHWLGITSAFDNEILNFVHQDRDLCAFFWTGLDDLTRNRLTVLVQSGSRLSDEVRAHHLSHLVQAA
jgi:tetratricopeptide (TPR) repeat protein